MSQSDSHGRIARGHVSVSAALHARLAAYCARTGVTMSGVLEHITADLPNVDDTLERAINAALDAESRPSTSRAPMVSHAAVRR